MQKLIINKIAQLGIVATLIFVSYIVGLNRGEDRCILATHKSTLEQAKKYNNTLDGLLQHQESSLTKLNTVSMELQNEIKKNKQLINANNKLSRQYQLLIDASAANMHTATSYAVHAGESSTATPDRILSTIQYNYSQCHRWREQVIMWQAWYKSNN